MVLPQETIVALPMAAAIMVFFWALDRVRKERRVRSTDVQAARATPRELVDRLLKPAAENLSQRRRVAGKPTLTEDLARAGLNVTAPEYLLIRIGAVALGALIGLFRFGFTLGPVILGAVGFVIPPLVVAYLQRRRQLQFNDQLASMLQLRINSPDLEFIVTAILLHIRVGGNLAEVLDNISDTLRDRLQTKRDMSVLTAQSRASASIITGLPILLALGLYVFVPGYYAPMTSTWVGYAMLGFAGFMILLGNLIIQRMTALEA